MSHPVLIPARRRARVATLAALAAFAVVVATPALAEERAVPIEAFEEVHVMGSARVRFAQGPVEEVVLEGDASELDGVEVDVRRGVLTVRPTGSWRFWDARRALVRITAPTLRRVSISGAADWSAPRAVEVDRLAVSISGSGNVRFDSLKADRLSFSVSGSGDGRVAGATRELSLSIAGRSSFDGEQLHSQQGKVSVSGIGNVKVWTTEDLTVSVSGIGTVDVWGAPRLRRSVAGQASINDRGAKQAVH